MWEWFSKWSTEPWIFWNSSRGSRKSTLFSKYDEDILSLSLLFPQSARWGDVTGRSHSRRLTSGAYRAPQTLISGNDQDAEIVFQIFKGQVADEEHLSKKIYETTVRGGRVCSIGARTHSRCLSDEEGSTPDVCSLEHRAHPFSIRLGWGPPWRDSPPAPLTSSSSRLQKLHSTQDQLKGLRPLLPPRPHL